MYEGELSFVGGVAMLSGGLIMEEETPLITDKRVL